ncbi:claudin-10-like [Hyla sarda]|uniref:claudin-10-like n=1 Tax=Hyla sarda TaxID=327740 RepID=UPI0024C24434|nr:claudin-10-like [Hyla sarda]
MLLLNVAGLVCSILGFILLVTGISTDFWLVDSIYHAGLWEICTKDMCLDIVGPGYINATRGLLIFSAVPLTFGIIFSCLSFMKIRVGRITACLASAILEVLAALFIAIGMSIYLYNISDYNKNFKSFHYQWSFYLCLAAKGLLIISGACHTRAHRLWTLPGYESV